MDSRRDLQVINVKVLMIFPRSFFSFSSRQIEWKVILNNQGRT